MAKTRKQMVDKMASKMKPMALKLGGKAKRDEVAKKFDALRKKGEQKDA